MESTDKKTTTRNADGQQFYDYELIGPVRHPLSVTLFSRCEAAWSIMPKMLIHACDRCLQTNNYLATVTLKQGKVYAFFVRSPAKVRASSLFPRPCTEQALQTEP